MDLQNAPYSHHLTWTIGIAVKLELALVLGLFGYRVMTGRTVFLPENAAAVVAWLVPYAILVGPIALIPMRDRMAAIYSKGAIFLTIGITLPFLFFLWTPKSPANAQAGILLFLILPIAGGIYLLLWGFLALEKFLSR